MSRRPASAGPRGSRSVGSVSKDETWVKYVDFDKRKTVVVIGHDILSKLRLPSNCGR